jgi:predicted metal-dependent enzyme (double-stranded beta helix superfamily)
VIQQGNLYQHGIHRVIALTSGEETVKVQALTGTHPSGMGRPFNTHALYLSPLPMKYFGGAIPGAKA